jgi:hypothetical protein
MKNEEKRRYLKLRYENRRKSERLLTQLRFSFFLLFFQALQGFKFGIKYLLDMSVMPKLAQGIFCLTV